MVQGVMVIILDLYVELLLELGRREKQAGILPEIDTDTYMKVGDPLALPLFISLFAYLYSIIAVVN